MAVTDVCIEKRKSWRSHCWMAMVMVVDKDRYPNNHFRTGDKIVGHVHRHVETLTLVHFFFWHNPYRSASRYLNNHFRIHEKIVGHVQRASTPYYTVSI